MDVNGWLDSIPPAAVYAIVAVVIGVESLGIPLPGEIALVSASLLAAKGVVDPVAVGACGALGAVVGDSIGYSIGRRNGRGLFDKLSARFPKHFDPRHLEKAESVFDRWGMWAVFFGRFVALLRIFAGPLSGTLGMPYWRFLIANVLGGICWAGGTTAAVYEVGEVADTWLKRFSWGALIVVVVVAAGAFLVMRRRAAAAARAEEETDPVTARSGE